MLGTYECPSSTYHEDSDSSFKAIRTTIVPVLVMVRICSKSLSQETSCDMYNVCIYIEIHNDLCNTFDINATVMCS